MNKKEYYKQWYKKNRKEVLEYKKKWKKNKRHSII